MEPFKKEEIELLIKACDFCEEAVTDRRRKFIMQRSTSKLIKPFCSHCWTPACGQGSCVRFV